MKKKNDESYARMWKLTQSRPGQWGFILIVLALLIIVLSILLQVRQREIVHSDELSIIYGETMVQPTAVDFDNLPLTTIRVRSGGEQSGYLIYDLLRYYEVDPDTVASIYFSSLDGSRMIVSPEEIEQGEVLLSPFEGYHKSYRLVFPLDPFRNRWLKDIVLIEIY